ncbi:ankyrin repeat domain-containing protein [Paenibacillus sp. PvR148]
MFIRKGIGPNLVDAEGTSALMHAVKAGHSKMVYELILAGANIDRQNNQGETARSAALASNNAGMLRILSSKTNTHCWSCKASIDSIRYLNCSTCKWIICPCSASGCNYSLDNSYRR